MLTPLLANRTHTAECDVTRARTFAACDGELSADELRSIDEHIVACASCRHRFAADATFHRVVRAAVACDVAPQSLRDRILLSLTTRTTVDATA
jgi:mycothiol system anti-sigma-R factor